MPEPVEITPLRTSKDRLSYGLLNTIIRRFNQLRRFTGDRNILVNETGQGVSIRWIGPTGGGTGDDSFLAVITGNAAMTGHTARWWYAWTEIMSWTAVLPSSGTAGTYVTTGGRTGTAIATPSGSDLGGAFSWREFSHVANPGSTTPWYVGGVQANSSATTTDYPSTFAPRPVDGGGATTTHVQNVIVRLRPYDFGGVTRYGFDGPAVTHDGACP